MRSFILYFLSIFCFSAHAATSTNSHVLGFSADGRYFVFEEFAVYDGAGIPKASLYIVDTTTDRWALGSPFRTSRSEADVDESVEQSVAIKSVLQEVRDLASGALTTIGPLEVGTVRYFKSPFDLTKKPDTVRVSLTNYHQAAGQANNSWSLTMTQTPFPPRQDCYDGSADMVGFSLSLKRDDRPDGHLLNEDKRIPKSRPCPLGYTIEQVVSYTMNSKQQALGILIRFSHPGFEGPDTSLLSIGTQVQQRN